MASIVPPPTPVPLPLPPTAAPLLLVPNPPQSLVELPLGALVEGTVLAQGGGRLIQIATPLGTLAAQTGFALPANASVDLLILALVPQAQLRIVAVNGKPLTPSGRPAAPSGIPGQSTADGARPGPNAMAASISSVASPARPAVTFAIGSTLTATFLQPPALARAAGSGAAQDGPRQAPGTGRSSGLSDGRLSPGSPSIGGRIATDGTSAGLGQTARGSSSAAAAPSSQPAPASTRGDGPPSPALSPGSQIPLRILAGQGPAPGVPAPTAAPASAAPILMSGAILSSHVVGMLPNGDAVVETPAGTFALPTRGALPVGVTLDLQVAGAPQAAAPLAHGSLAQNLLGFERSWSTLDEALAVIAGIDPAIARQVAANAVPRADSHLAATVLLFMTALRGGNLGGWLGEGATRILQRNRPDLFERLGDDLGRIGRLAEEPGGGQWRTLLFPFHSGVHVELVHLYTRRRKKDEDGEDGDAAGNRFVVDVRLSRLGRMQFDGFVKEKQKHFDLIVRSEEPLPGPMRDNIREIFRDAAEITGIKGGISFQAAPPDFAEVERPEPGVGLPDLLV